MIPSQVAALFAVIAFYDHRVQFDEGKLHAWHAALDGDMDFDYAKQLVIKHYADTDEAVTPSALNIQWRIEATAREMVEKRKQFNTELEARAALAVPMPDDVKRLAKALAGKADVDLAVFEVACPHCKQPAGRHCLSPEGLPLTKSYAHPSRFEKAGIKNAKVAVRPTKSSSDS